MSGRRDGGRKRSMLKRMSSLAAVPTISSNSALSTQKHLSWTALGMQMKSFGFYPEHSP